MKKIVFLIVFLFLLIGCNPGEEPEVEADDEVQEETSKCDSYSEGPRKVLCYAMEAKDITMCADIEGRFREECVVVLAELVYDTSLIDNCDLAEASANKKICSALISEDVDVCFSSWTQGEGLGASLNMRDCIDLTCRKLKDTDCCNAFETRASELLNVCGKSSDCEGQWIDGAEEHASSCKDAVEVALGYTN